MPDELAEAASEVDYDPSVDPILCSPFEEPHSYWPLDRTGRALSGMKPESGRRPSMLLSPVPDDQKPGHLQLSLDDDVHLNRLINDIRGKVSAWRAGGYLGATSVTVRLLEHWADERGCKLRPFFAQREAIETLVWLREVATRTTPERRELETLSRQHNDEIVRHAVKMATGTGKTVVMGMLIAWQTLNAARTTRRRNIQHGERFLVLTPGLTVRNRLAELKPSSPHNVYDDMGLVPRDLRPVLNRARVEVMNFQAFSRQNLNTLGFPRSGSKGGRAHRDLIGRPEGDEHLESYEQSAQRVLKSLLTANAYGNLVVLNDEAHHCYLPKSQAKRSAEDKKEDKRAAVWFNVLRSLRDMGQLGEVNQYGQASVVYDFSATPMWIDTSGRATPDPFQWVASDFGLMDAIESGLTKVPRVPVDDDSIQERTVWRNLYEATDKKKIPRPSEDGPAAEIPVPLRTALNAQYHDYKVHLALWSRVRPETAPVMIVVANTIDNANALHEHIAGWEDSDGILREGAYPELTNVEQGQYTDDLRTIVVHSNLDDSSDLPAKAAKLIKAQGQRLNERRGRSKDALETVREVLNTVGKAGRPGARVRCVISVGMLTEGWDARNVSHIVGYRAFSTQLLCEQVTGRALRRTSYEDFRFDGTGRLRPEYAEVVGIPFEFMPSRGGGTGTSPVRPVTHVHTVRGRGRYRIVWPQVREYRRVTPSLKLAFDESKSKAWKMEPPSGASMTVLSPHVGEEKILEAKSRRGEAEFRIAQDIVAEFRSSTDDDTDGTSLSLFRSARRIVGQWLQLDYVKCDDPAVLLSEDQQRRDAVLTILDACTSERGQEHQRVAVLDSPPRFDTSDVSFDTTLEHIHEAKRSELSQAACHSNLEKQVAVILDTHERVEAWARNFQTSWSVPYFFNGSWRRYEPDFIARLTDGTNLIVECKGVRDDKAIAAETYVLHHWIPCVAGTSTLPDALRQWTFVEIQDAKFARHQIDQVGSGTPQGEFALSAAD